MTVDERLERLEKRCNPEFARIVEAYIAMAKQVNYRPAAPGDGMGSTFLTKQQICSSAVLNREAERYAASFIAEEDTSVFVIGCSVWETNRALVYLIEASRLLCGGLHEPQAKLLIKMALKEVQAILANRKRQRWEFR